MKLSPLQKKLSVVSIILSILIVVLSFLNLSKTDHIYLTTSIISLYSFSVGFDLYKIFSAKLNKADN